MSGKVYVLGFQSSVDWDAVQGAATTATIKQFAESMRDAADEVEEFSYWKPGMDMCHVVALDVNGLSPAAADDAIKAALKQDLSIRYMTIDDVQWTDRDFTVVDFPEWAICHLANGDPLDDADDINDFGEWEKRMVGHGYSMNDFEILDDRNEFCANPAFGLASATIKVRFLKEKEA